MYKAATTRISAAAPVTAAPTAASAAPVAAPAAFATTNINSSRRGLLAALAAATTTTALSLALPSNPASAAIGVWDGSSAALGSCAVGPDGDACRAQTLARDFGAGGAGTGGKAAAGGGKGYDGSKLASTQLSTNTSGGIPIAKMDEAYVSQTRSLVSDIREYLALAPTDASRVPKGKAIRKSGAAWGAKFAPGGSARKPSARKFYIAVDALQGHLAANGAAPYPASKAAKLLASIETVEDLLAKGQ